MYLKRLGRMLLNEYPPLLVVCLLKFIIGIVRMIGLEPTRLTAPDPKSGAATNYATSACVAFLFSGAKIGRFSDLANNSTIKLFT